MAWYDYPVSLFKAAVHTPTDMMYNQVGTASYLVGQAASLAGVDSVAKPAKDLANYSLTAPRNNIVKGLITGDSTNTFTAAPYSAPAGNTPQEREAQKTEANRLTENVVNNIAPVVETIESTAVDTVTFIPSRGAGVAKTVTAKVVGFVAPTAAAAIINIPTTVSELADKFLPTGEAPIIKWYDKTPFIKDFIGDPHYAAGGTPDTHPARIGYQDSNEQNMYMGAGNATARAVAAGAGKGGAGNAGGAGENNGSWFSFSAIGAFFKGAIEAIESGVTAVTSWVGSFFKPSAAAPTATNNPAASNTAAPQQPSSEQIPEGGFTSNAPITTKPVGLAVGG